MNKTCANRARHRAPTISVAKGNGRSAVALLLYMVAGLFGSVPAAGQVSSASDQQGDDPDILPYQVYDTMEVRALHESSLEHLAAGRIPEALEDLQNLLENHGGEVLPALRKPAATGLGSVPSVVHVGASSWAHDQLFELSAQAVQTYRRMYGAQAQAALELAMQQGERSDWVEVTRRWPITQAAARARWALGDMAMEAGHSQLGRSAWARALACELRDPLEAPATPQQWQQALQALGESQEAGLASRLPAIEARVRWLLKMSPRGKQSAKSNTATALRPGTVSLGTLDQYEAGWAEPFEMPRHPMMFDWGFQVQGTTDGDRLFVNTSRQILALGLWTGESQWSSPLETAGWTVEDDQDPRFQEAMDFRGGLFAPAVAQGVVVASLQLPFVLIPPDHFRQIQIIRVVPERRLFAFDSETGRALWNTAPPRDWDGESGPARERVSIAGPPIIERSRVVVPTVHLRGRVEFHVDCFDLKTGKALWHTPLVTGQRELNMFGREISEFTAPPVRIEGDRVLVATQLGSVVCLDLVTGATLWQSLYPQIEISKATYYSPGHMRSLWINSPPVVVDDLVLVAPTDGDSLLALDLFDGRMRWSMNHKEFRDRRSGARSRVDFHYLLDADRKSVVLGGRRVASFTPNMGTLAEAPPRRLVWIYPTGESISNPGLRAVSSGGQILVPTDGELVGVDRRNGRPQRSLDWSGHKGSPLLTELGLFTLGNREVYSFLDWKENLKRARRALASDPDDGEALYDLALLLQKRGQAARLARPEPRLAEARRSLAEARKLLREALSRDPSAARARQRTLLFETHLEEGRLRRLSASPAGARNAWEQALALALGDQEVSTALLMLVDLDRGRDEVRLRQRLRRLATEFVDLQVACRLLRPGSTDEDPPASARWIPMVSTARTDRGREETVVHLPLALWARMEYADSVLAAGGPGSKGASMTSPYPDLYHIVQHYADQEWIDGSAGQAASSRIRNALDRGFENGFDAIQDQAQELLQRALESEDMVRLEEVQRHFPHTPQSQRAGDQRIRHAADTGLIGLLAEVVLRDFPAEFSLSRCTPSQREHLALLALKVGEQGGLTFRSELGKRLSASAPRQTMELDGTGTRSMHDWSLQWSAQVPVPRTPPAPSFPSAMESVQARSPLIAGPGLWIPPSLQSPDTGTPRQSKDAAMPQAQVPSVTLRLWNDPQTAMPTVAAFAGDPNPLWTLPDSDERQGPERWAVSPGRAHIATSESLITLQRESGAQLWRWQVDREQFLDSVLHSQGVLVLNVINLDSQDEPTGEFIQVGLEASSGTELWRRRVRSNAFHHHTLLGSGYQLLVSTGSHPSQVFDLFSGSAGPALQTGRLNSASLRASWIEDGKWIIPTFARLAVPSKNHIEAYDLATGLAAWRVPFGTSRELWRVLRHQGDTYLEVYSSPAKGPRFMSMHELDVGRGKMSDRARFGLPEGGLLIGLPKRATVQLQSPWVFARITLATGSGLRALHLREGKRWERSIPAHLSMVRPESLPRPITSKEAVAVAFPKRGSRGQPDLTTYYILTYDKRSGRQASDLMIRARGPKNARCSLSALGPWLVFGKGHVSHILGTPTR